MSLSCRETSWGDAGRDPHVLYGIQVSKFTCRYTCTSTYLHVPTLALEAKHLHVACSAYCRIGIGLPEQAVEYRTLALLLKVKPLKLSFTNHMHAQRALLLPAGTCNTIFRYSYCNV